MSELSEHLRVAVRSLKGDDAEFWSRIEKMLKANVGLESVLMQLPL